MDEKHRTRRVRVFLGAVVALVAAAPAAPLFEHQGLVVRFDAGRAEVRDLGGRQTARATIT